MMLIGNAVAVADWNPSGPITIMIAFHAGGGAATQARLIDETLEAEHGWKFISQQGTGKGVNVDDLVNLASAISSPLKVLPDASLLSDLGVPRFNADGYFL